MSGLIDATTGLRFGSGLQFLTKIGGAGLQIVTATFTPASLFTGGYLGDWWDANNIATLYQDSAKTTPVTADNDPVGAWVGLVNGVTIVQATAGAKPLYKSSNKTVLCDGVDDSLMTAAAQSWSGYPFSIAALFDQSVTGAGGGNGAIGLSASPTDYACLGLISNFSLITDRAAATVISSPGLSFPGASGFAAVFATFQSGAQALKFNNGSSGTAAATNTHAAPRVILGAGRQSAGTPSLFQATRIQDLIVINKALSADDMTSLRTYWGV